MKKILSILMILVFAVSSMTLCFAAENTSNDFVITMQIHKPLQYPTITTNSFTSACTAISINCKKPELAMQLLNLIWKDTKLSNTLAFGLEGQDYVVTAGEGTDNPTVKANEGAEQKWAVWHNWIGPLFDQWDSNWNTKAALEEMQYNNKHADVSPINGFTFNPDAVATEVATVNSILTEIRPVIYTGSMTDFDSYIAEARKRLEQAGIEKIKAEVQKQLDEWLKTKKDMYRSRACGR